MTDVTRYNFKTLRKKNKIKVEAISNMCKLSVNTIRHFENSCTKGYTDGVLARDYNADLIIRTLQKFIDEKEENMGVNSESKKVEPKVKMRSADLSAKISAYAKANEMTVKEFAKMCNVSHNVFAAYYAKTTEYASPSTINKICQATGWTVDQLISGDILNNSKNEEDNMSYIGTPKSLEALKQAELKELKKPSVTEVEIDSNIETSNEINHSVAEPERYDVKASNGKSIIIEFSEFEKFEKALVNLQKDRLDSMHGYMAYPVRKENIGYYNAMTDVLELVSELKTKAKLQ